MPAAGYVKYPVSGHARQSPPLDLKLPISIDPAFIKGKTILITGGASGFGKGFCARWAAAGATVVIGDVNVAGGQAVVKKVRKETGNPKVHFIQLDVTSWPSQVRFFREALKFSPHGGIDTVVANAGINNAVEAATFENPAIDYINDPNPPAPTFKTMDVNLTGTLYTTHLALYYLPRNPGSEPCSPTLVPADTPRDRHLLLLGSLASLYPIVTQIPYAVSKHGVLGLYRCLRITAPMTAGVRVNLLCPYFTDTPIVNGAGRTVLAGIPMGKPEDVVEAATLFVANPQHVGRALVTGPRVKVKSPVDADGAMLGGASGTPDLEDVRIYEADVGTDAGDGIHDRALWECYAHDMEDTDYFTRRMVAITNAAALIRGWAGWGYDLAAALTWPVRQWWSAPRKVKLT